MPPKKTTTAAKPAAKSQAGPTYEDMIKDAIQNLKERKGSSRASLKKYVQQNNKKTAAGPSFDKFFNNALSKGVTKGIFAQPKGPSGSVKLAPKVKPTPTDEKKPATEKAATKPAAKKTTAAAKKTVGAPKKAAAAPKTKAAATKATTTKKAPAAPKKAAVKKTGPKKAAPAPAVEDKPVILGKTKGGRITKTTSKSAPAAKKVTKVPAKSKATPKKATPKKA